MLSVACIGIGFVLGMFFGWWDSARFYEVMLKSAHESTDFWIRMATKTEESKDEADWWKDSN